MNTENNDSEDSSLNSFQAYKIALETRNMEIALFWQRSNYFLVLNAALAVGFFRLSENKYAITLAVFGLFVSLIWYRVNLGSKYWQSRWEQRLKLKEDEIDSALNYFSASRSITDQDVKNNIGYSEYNLHTNNTKSKFHKWLDKQVIKKPSVSYNMSLLSFCFMFMWLIFLLIKLYSN